MAVSTNKIQTSLYLGLEGLCEKIRVDINKGLTGSDLPERRDYFGHNVAKKPIAEGFWAKFWGALQDFMLKVLIVSGTVSITTEMIISGPEQRKTCKLIDQRFLQRVSSFYFATNPGG